MFEMLDRRNLSNCYEQLPRPELEARVEPAIALSCGSCFHVSKDFITVGVQSSVLAFEVTISYHQSLMSRSFLDLLYDLIIQGYPIFCFWLAVVAESSVVTVKRVRPQTIKHGRWWNEEPLTIFDLYHDVSIFSEKV